MKDFTVSALSREIKVSRSWIYKEVESGRMPYYKLGNKLRFQLDKVLAAYGRDNGPSAADIKAIEQAEGTEPIDWNKA